MRQSTFDTIGVGIVGCGQVARRFHMPALRAAAPLRVVAVADSDTRQLNRVADRFGIAARYPDLAALLQDPAVQVVAICTPPQQHVPLACAALQARRHVLVEKPLALCSAECDRLLASAAASDRKLQVGFNLRHHHFVRRARDLVRAGAIGQVQQIRSRFLGCLSPAPGQPDWRSTETLAGHVLFELATHHFDTWRFLLDSEVTEIHATAVQQSLERDAVSVSGRMGCGTELAGAFAKQGRPANELELVGTAGLLRINLYRFDGLERVSPKTGRSTRLGRLARAAGCVPGALAAKRYGGQFRRSYVRQWRDLAGAILNDTPCEAALEDGRNATAIALTALRWLEGHTPAPVDPRHPPRATQPVSRALKKLSPLQDPSVDNR